MSTRLPVDLMSLKTCNVCHSRHVMSTGKRVDGSKPGIEGFFGTIFGEDSKATKALTDATSSSPIQRTVTSIDAFIVSQDITLGGISSLVSPPIAQSEQLASDREATDQRVDQRVTFNKDAYLRLSASASTSDQSTSVPFVCVCVCVRVQRQPPTTPLRYPLFLCVSLSLFFFLSLPFLATS